MVHLYPFAVGIAVAAVVEIVGVDVVPHQFSQELRWRSPFKSELGALVRLFVTCSVSLAAGVIGLFPARGEGNHPDRAATTLVAWQQGRIPMSEFSSAGVKMNAVKR